MSGKFSYVVLKIREEEAPAVGRCFFEFIFIRLRERFWYMQFNRVILAQRRRRGLIETG